MWISRLTKLFNNFGVVGFSLLSVHLEIANCLRGSKSGPVVGLYVVLMERQLPLPNINFSSGRFESPPSDCFYPRKVWGLCFFAQSLQKFEVGTFVGDMILDTPSWLILFG